MAHWLLAAKLSLLIMIGGIVALVLPNPPWALVYSYLLLGAGLLLFMVAAVVVGRRFLRQSEPPDEAN
jgi:membrane protein implicated in regulation of membrane protease activity